MSKQVEEKTTKTDTLTNGNNNGNTHGKAETPKLKDERISEPKTEEREPQTAPDAD